MDRKPVTIQYRQFQDKERLVKGSTLQEALRATMESKHAGKPIRQRWTGRLWDPMGDRQDTYFINIYLDNNTYIFGSLVHFSHGYFAAAFDAKMQEKDRVDLHQLPPPEGSEYVRDVLFWMVAGNHVLLVQGKGLRSRRFEEYLRWLMTERGKAMTGADDLVLAKRISPRAARGLEEGINQVVIGSSLAGSIPRPQEEVREEARAGRNVRDGAIVRGVLEALFPRDRNLLRRLEQLEDGAEILVRVSLSYKARRKESGRQTLRAIGEAVRNLDEEDVVIIGDDGKRFLDGEAQLMKKVHVEHRNGMLSAPDVERHMHALYAEYRQSGIIR